MTDSGLRVHVSFVNPEKLSFIGSFRESWNFDREVDLIFSFNGKAMGQPFDIILKLDDGDIIKGIYIDFLLTMNRESDSLK